MVEVEWGISKLIGIGVGVGLIVGVVIISWLKGRIKWH